PPARRIYSRCLQTTPPANSGSPKPSHPWPPPPAGKVVPPRSAHPAEAHARENVLEPPVPALTAPRATATVARPGTDRPPSEHCRSCRAPNKDWVPSAKSPSKARKPARSHPFVHRARRLPPSPPPTWRNPDSPAPATGGLPRIDRRGCTLPPRSAAHSHTPDGPLPPTAPVQSRDRARPAGCTLSPAPSRIGIPRIQRLPARQQQQIVSPVHLLCDRCAHITAAQREHHAPLHCLRAPSLDGRQPPQPHCRQNRKSDRRQIHVTVAHEIAVVKVSQIQRRRQPDQQ